MKKQQRVLDGLRKDVQAEMTLLQEKLEMLEKRAGEGEKDRQKVEAQKEEIRRTMLEVGSLESKNLKQMAAVYEKWDAEVAAQTILHMVESGKLDMAVTILVHMGSRQAAALLAEVTKEDRSVAVQLIDRMRLHKAQAQTQK